jgi:malate synthase
MSVKTYDEVISQRNDHLKLNVKRLEKMVSELMNQIKVRRSQDNHKNMVNKFEKDSNIIKQAFQQSNMTQPLKKQQKIIEEEKIEYARSAYLNTRRT